MRPKRGRKHRRHWRREGRCCLCKLDIMGLPCVKCKRAQKSQRGPRQGELAIKVVCAYFKQKCNIKTLNKCQTYNTHSNVYNFLATWERDETSQGKRERQRERKDTERWQRHMKYTSRCRSDKCDKVTWQPCRTGPGRFRLVIWYEFTIYTDDFPARPRPTAFRLLRATWRMRNSGFAAGDISHQLHKPKLKRPLVKAKSCQLSGLRCTELWLTHYN